MRPLLRVALLRVLLGAVPPAPVPVVRATADHAAAVLGPVAAAPAVATTTPLAAPTTPPVPHPEPPPPSVPARAPVSTNHSSPTQAPLPLAFVQNTGQFDTRVRYQTRGLGGSVFFTPDEVVLAVPTDAQQRRPHPQNPKPGMPITATLPISLSVVRLRYEGAENNPTLIATDPLPGTENYLVGRDPSAWRTGITTYGGISYQQIYPGIDLSFAGLEGRIKSTYLVAAGANPTRIRWRYSGAKAIQVDPAGNLQIILDPAGKGRPQATTPYTLTEQAPLAWQIIGGQRVPIAVRYQVAPNQSISFALGSYDTTQPLTIDPTLAYGNYLGGNNADAGYSIAADALGSVRRTVTDAGVPLGVINYDPWGTPETGTVPTFGFTGEVQDVGAGLVNLRARWYSTARGRFTSVDPFAGVPETPYSLHQYAYGFSDPVLYTDPSGRLPECALALATGPAAPVVGGLCVILNLAVAVAAGMTIGTVISCTGQITCPSPNPSAPGLPPVPAPGPLPPDAQPQPLPAGHPIPTTMPATPVPAPVPVPGPAPAPGTTPTPSPLPLPVRQNCPTPTPPSTPTPTPTSKRANLDTGAVWWFVSADISMRAEAEAYVHDRQMVITRTAFREVFRAVITIAGPVEKANAAIFMARVQEIEDDPSARALSLRKTGGIGNNDIIIFGTGDRLGIPTMTNDGSAIRAAAAQGVNFDHFLRRTVSLTGR